MKLALFLTLMRVFLTPLFIAFYLYPEFFGFSSFYLPFALLVVLILCELSDAFDGYAARKKGEVTELGKILDPMADSIVRSSMLITFTQGIVELPILLILIFIYRDSMISTLRTVCALKGTALAARKSGKIKAVVQAIVIFLIVILMIPESLGWIERSTFQKIAFYAVFSAAVYTVISGFEYIWVNFSAIKKSWVKVR